MAARLLRSKRRVPALVNERASSRLAGASQYTHAGVRTRLSPTGPAALTLPRPAKDNRGRCRPLHRMTIPLDDIDRTIIALLQRDGRMSAPAIAEAIGDITPRAIRYRIRRLVENRAIFIGAIVSADAVGYPVAADILIEAVPWKLQQIAEKIAALDAVSYAASSVQEGRISIQAYAHTEQEIADLARSFATDYDGVTRVQTMVLPHLLKDITGWTAPQED